MLIEMVPFSSSLLNAQVIGKELKKTLPNDVDRVFSLRKNHAGLISTLWKNLASYNNMVRTVNTQRASAARKYIRLRKPHIPGP